MEELGVLVTIVKPLHSGSFPPIEFLLPPKIFNTPPKVRNQTLNKLVLELMSKTPNFFGCISEGSRVPSRQVRFTTLDSLRPSSLMVLVSPMPPLFYNLYAFPS